MNTFLDHNSLSPLVVLDLANNHNGSVAHGKKIIDSLADVLVDGDPRIAIKFQYRQLDTFIHPKFHGNHEWKYIKRFEETALTSEDFAQLKAHVEARGFLSACTPFDEGSVDLICAEGYDYLKVASVSCTDWPLLERVALAGLPTIISTAGVSFGDLDRVVSFIKHRDVSFALMHCVAAYPTPDDALNLNRLDALSTRYPGIPIGYSTHENPENAEAVMVAVAKGATILERHVGSSSNGESLNAYSSEATQIRDWLDAIKRAQQFCGVPADGQLSLSPSSSELEALQGLRRGVYLNRTVKQGERLSESDVRFAIPLQTSQVSANDWSKYCEFVATCDLEFGEPVLWTNLTTVDRQERVREVVENARRLFSVANLQIPSGAELEISHHYGLDRFTETGLLMVTVVNKAYCKKILGIFSGQHHPEQWHDLKSETFVVLHGQIRLKLDGEEGTYCPGAVVTVEPGVRHEFWGVEDSIIEEISSTHNPQDSFYTDDQITANSSRKTIVKFW